MIGVIKNRNIKLQYPHTIAQKLYCHPNDDELTVITEHEFSIYMKYSTEKIQRMQVLLLCFSSPGNQHTKIMLGTTAIVALIWRCTEHRKKKKRQIHDLKDKNNLNERKSFNVYLVAVKFAFANNINNQKQ